MDKDNYLSSGPLPDKTLWKPEENLIRPRLISRLEAFIKVSEQHNLLPNLKITAKQMLEKMTEKWHDLRPQDFYPAFKF